MPWLTFHWVELFLFQQKAQEFLFNCTEFALCEIDLHSSPQELSKGLCYNFMIQVWIFSLSMENVIEVWIWFVLFIAWKIRTILYWIMSRACSISIGSMQHLKMPKHKLQTSGILKSLWWVGLKDTSYWDQLLRHNWSLWCWCWWQSHKIWEVDTLCWVILSSWWDKSMHSSSVLQKWYCPSLSSISSSESPWSAPMLHCWCTSSQTFLNSSMGMQMSLCMRAEVPINSPQQLWNNKGFSFVRSCNFLLSQSSRWAIFN